jgi:hypothetical protein
VWEATFVENSDLLKSHENASLSDVVTMMLITASRTYKTKPDHEFVAFWEKNAVEADWIVRVAIMISCGLPASAYEWARNILRSVRVHCKDTTFIAMVPHSVWEERSFRKFYLTQGRERCGNFKRWGLVAIQPSTPEPRYSVCLFPLDTEIAE